jgi:hypothetical protein
MGGDALTIRYEDAVQDPLSTLARVSAFTGVQYDASSLRYWEFEHHMPSGNSGALDILVRLQGGDGLNYKRTSYYDDMVNHLRKNNGVPKIDESWKSLYSEVELAAYDFAAGKQYEVYGYPRQVLSPDAVRKFHRKYAPPDTPEAAERRVKPWVRSNFRAKLSAVKAKFKQYRDSVVYLVKSLPSRFKL